MVTQLRDSGGMKKRDDAVVWPYVSVEGGPILGYTFYCPGCEHHHAFTTHESQKLVWSFNGDLERPTFAPSLVNTTARGERKCHLFVRDGRIEYLNDCFHKLKGATIPMEKL